MFKMPNTENRSPRSLLPAAVNAQLQCFYAQILTLANSNLPLTPEERTDVLFTIEQLISLNQSALVVLQLMVARSIYQSSHIHL